MIPGLPSPSRRQHAVTNARQEDDFIFEWLNYHLWIGFDHVFIFCQDDSPARMDAMLEPYVDAGLVTVRPWAVGDQKHALLHFLDKEQVDNQTVFFADADEFLVLCEHASVGDFLADSRVASSTCMHFPWLRFGTSFLPMHPRGRSPVLTHYFLRDPLDAPSPLGKVAIRSPLFPHTRRSVHHRCTQYKESRNAEVPMSMARMNHYWVRNGMEAFKQRVERGSGGNFYGQKQYATRDIRDSNTNNRVADATLLSILEEFPGLMAPGPPSERRRVLPEGYCKDGINPWTEEQEKAIFMNKGR